MIELVKRHLAMTIDLIEDTKLKLKKFSYLSGKVLVSRERKNGSTDYYERDASDAAGALKPLGKADNKTVIDFKRRQYFRVKLESLENDKRTSQRFLKTHKAVSPEAVVKELPKKYQGLPVNSYEDVGLIELPHAFGHVPDNIYRDPRFQELLAWSAQDYKRNPYPLPPEPNIARDGTPMRSKGECMWYDNALFEGLPAWVDPEIKLKGKSGLWHTFYPDFVFKCFDGTLIFVEHYGNLDDDEYGTRKLRKIQEYLDCGIVLGDNLIVTSDNAEHCTNELMIIDALERIKKRVFA